MHVICGTRFAELETKKWNIATIEDILRTWIEVRGEGFTRSPVETLRWKPRCPLECFRKTGVEPLEKQTPN